MGSLKSLDSGRMSQAYCICHDLHVDCDPVTCREAAKPKNGQPPYDSSKKLHLLDFKKAAASGCSCCALLYDGLLVPEIASTWRRHLKGDDELLEVELMPYKMMVRVSNDIRPYNISRWCHFAFYRQPGWVATSSPCRAFPIPTSLSESTGSETSWRNLRTWLEVCEKHTACRRIPFAPKRVLDLGVGANMVFLISANIILSVLNLFRRPMFVYYATPI